MKNIKNILVTIIFIQLFLLNKGFVYGIILNAIAFSIDGNQQTYTPLIEEFNNYSQKNNLDIRIELNLLTRLNITYSTTDYGSMVEALLKKKNSKKNYVLYFYDNAYLNYYGEYLLNLNGLIPKEHIEMYDNKILADSCYYDDNKLVGLPVKIYYSVLYCNDKYLKKHNEKIPETWEELLKTSKKILNE